MHDFYQNGESRIIPPTSTTPALSLSPQEEIRQNLANSIPTLMFNSSVFKHLLLRWIITNNIPFQQAVSPVLRLLFMYLCAVVSNYILLNINIKTNSYLV